jgi:hypothetical protein
MLVDIGFVQYLDLIKFIHLVSNCIRWAVSTRDVRSGIAVCLKDSRFAAYVDGLLPSVRHDLHNGMV